MTKTQKEKFAEIYVNINKRKDIARKVSRSNNQQEIAERLLQGEKLQFNLDICTGNRIAKTYHTSTMNLINRMKDLGYKFYIEKGKRGGYWTSTFRITNLTDSYGGILNE